MNVFEDLVVELKEENLLEDTVMDSVSSDENDSANAYAEANSLFTGENYADRQYEPAIRLEADAAESADLQLMGSDETVEIRRPSSELEFFKKRAMGEVSSLQMVEHVLSAVEREQMKIIPKAYDDLEVKKALHLFTQVSDVAADEHKELEFHLMQEIESWCSALAIRDRNITVAGLRRYCENCRPMLSSQAILSLARFYRNLPYSEAVRGKFDYIITRLFSRDAQDETRRLLFTRDEMLGHVKTLYADWSSIPLYSADDESKVEMAANSFGELTEEARSAKRFDDLIKSDFFGRLRLFKESIAEMFFAPLVTAAAIAGNINIGNIFVELIDKERRKAGAAITHEKYAFLDEHGVSEAAGQTLELADLLRRLGERPAAEDDEFEEPEDELVEERPTEKSAPECPAITFADAKPRRDLKFKNGIFGINKWLVIGGFILISLSAGLWIWANYFVGQDQPTSVGVKRPEIEGTSFREHLKLYKVAGDTFYGVMQPTWQTMTKEKREELLKSIYQYGEKGGWANVSLSDATGKDVGYASSKRFEITDQ